MYRYSHIPFSAWVSEPFALPDTCLQNTSLHPQLGVLPVQPLDMRGHGRRVSLAQALVEAAGQSELSHTLVPLDNSANLEQTVGGADVGLSGGITAADGDAVIGLVEDFEVIGDDCADLVAARQQIRSLPEMVGSIGTLVL